MGVGLVSPDRTLPLTRRDRKKHINDITRVQADVVKKQNVQRNPKEKIQNTHFIETNSETRGVLSCLPPGMMPLYWVMIIWMLPRLAFLSNPDRCTLHDTHGSHDVLMQSLQCHNDYESYVHCKWREGQHIRAPLQLWFQTQDSRERCELNATQVQNENGHRTVQCRYETRSFSIGIEHTVFFHEDDILCSSVPRKPLRLSHHLRARTPVDLSTHDTGDGHVLLKWSNPYPAHSSLNRSLMYQLSYKADRQATWTIMNVTRTDVKLETRILLPGRRFEARVRGRASVGQWSHWSPVVTWSMKEDSRQFPSLHCVLDGEKVVTCSWEVSRELDHFITYQLACQHNHTARSDRCCVKPTVTFDASRPLVRYSCSLAVSNPAHLLLELRPTRNAKMFKANTNIQPRPPQQVKVREKDHNWVVEWAKPSTASKIRLYYQVWYYSRQDQDSSILLNISEGSTSVTILGSSLSPSQHHQVQVRSLVIPGEGSRYEGSPSEWTEPVDWTSHAATWPLTTIIYSTISLIVVSVFCVLYITIPQCHSKMTVWGSSIPSPGKSKALSEIKCATNGALIESTYICKVQHLDRLSTCSSSSSSLRPTEDAENKDLEQDRQECKCNSLPPPAQGVNGSDLPVHFSGPYILCQSTESKCMCDGTTEKEQTPSGGPDSSSSVFFTQYGDGYLCLPPPSVSMSTQALVTHCDANTKTQKREQDQQCADNAAWPDKLVDIQPDSSDTPPSYSSGPSWPTIRASGEQIRRQIHVVFLHGNSGMLLKKSE
ncbi:cytokine receptor common subunit beta isoform X3 [Dunckerocampus dactyliophorus]|uniref:cytokine receptor common subunit beta isoform X3 n=1 Tax=Dunckerocampus dactyliophorus TaxID=161453 RepID=UPI00240579F0|nr:cytokine receptor common subunit beta isoform X3 [Dunckerocampus dactyliophorus]